MTPRVLKQRTPSISAPGAISPNIGSTPKSGGNVSLVAGRDVMIGSQSKVRLEMSRVPKAVLVYIPMAQNWNKDTQGIHGGKVSGDSGG